jgi:hypothetical protein
MRHGVVLALVLLLAFSAVAPAPVAAQSDTDELAFLIARARERPSLIGPLEGELPIETGTVYLEPAGVSLRDFYARAAFTSPYPGEEHLWDVGFSFRSTSPDDDFRFILDSEGAWFFKEGVDPPIATGQLAGLATGAGGITRIDLVASGETGYIAVNGAYVATLDLTARDLAGDVAVGTGYYAEDQRAGERTPYAEFEVWSLAAAPPPAPDQGGGADGEGVEIVLHGEGEVAFDLLEEAGSGVFGLVSLRAREEQTQVEIGAFGTTGTEPVAIYEGACATLPPAPVFTLNPVDPDTLTSDTIVAASFAELTDGNHAVVIRASDDSEAILACNEIPTP